MVQGKAPDSQPSEAGLGSLQQGSKCFIYLAHSGYAVYCLFSIYIEFCLHPESQGKKKATRNLTAYLILNITTVLRTEAALSTSMCGEKKRSIVEMCLCCFIYH